MGDEHLEKRTCARFMIPGSTVSYRKDKALSKKGEYSAEFCPLVDISRGGIRFLSNEILKFETRLFLKIAIPGETIPFVQRGIVRWFGTNPGKSYKYQIGVQFYPYGDRKGQNPPANLTKIIALEQKFLDETTIVKEETSKGKSEYEI